jgi:hypothetical protein
MHQHLAYTILSHHTYNHKLSKYIHIYIFSKTQSEAAQAWDLLESCGASMERILESQLDEKSFMIQVSVVIYVYVCG